MIENECIYYVYRHIRLDKNEPFYIGIGTKQNKKYYNRSYTTHRTNAIWKKIVSKTKYKIEIIFECNDYEFIKEKEKEFIKLYGRKNLNNGTLANLTNGGEGNLGWIPSKETRDRISKTNKGRKTSQETREKLSKANKGKKGQWKHTKETKDKLSKLRTGTTHSEKTKKHLSKIHSGKKHEWNEKQIHQYNLNGEFIKSFKSVTEASLRTKILICDISYCALGNKHTAGNFQWKYEKFDKIEAFDRKQNSINKSKTIIQYDLNMNFIKEWKGSRQPSEKLNINRAAIRNCLSNIAKTAGGYIWKYKEHEELNNKENG